MSWQAGSFIVLAGTLLAGFGWFERSRPSSHVVAIVAAMAAVAIGGRIVFAAIPNVTPATDIILITGFALGAAPGFIVGALTALVSNFALGQGPWTPWQMAGWGAVGVAGGALAVVLRGRTPGRWTLAVVCALAGLAYGALQNWSIMVTYGGEVSIERYLALSAAAIPFDLAHAIGNATLAVVAGPALLTLLRRHRRRFEVTWRPAPPTRSDPTGPAVETPI